MADLCLPAVQVCALRIAALDSDGTILGGNTMYITDAMATVKITANIEAGDEVKEKNGCGQVTVDYKAPDNLNWYDVEFDFIKADPYLFSLLLPTSELLTASGGRVGFAAPALGLLEGDGVSVEMWAKRIKNGALDLDFPYQWWVLPLVKNFSEGDKTLDSGAQHTVLKGQAFENTGFFDGPANDWPSNDAPATRAYQWLPSTTLPTAACGFQADVAS